MEECMTTSIFNNRDVRSGEGFGGSGKLLFRVLLFGGALFFAVLLLSSIFRTTRIGAGYVGVEVNLAGSQRGAQDIPVRTGWVFYSPLKTQVIEFPTFVQTVKWTSDVNEGHPINEELVFNSKEGQEARAKVQEPLSPVGVQIQQFGFIGKPRFTAAIEQAITQKTQAITEAERARNQLAVTQAAVAKT